MASGESVAEVEPRGADSRAAAAEAQASAGSDEPGTGMWPMEAASAADCDCPGPPPQFLLPPPPRPPFLQDITQYCSEDPLPDIETCDALPVSQARH